MRIFYLFSAIAVFLYFLVLGGRVEPNSADNNLKYSCWFL